MANFTWYAGAYIRITKRGGWATGHSFGPNGSYTTGHYGHQLDEHNNTVSIVGAPAGYSFSNVSYSTSGNTAVYSVYPNLSLTNWGGGSITLKANFTPIIYKFTASTSGNSAEPTLSASTGTIGQTFTTTAGAANIGYRFKDWTITGAADVTSTTATTTIITVGTNNITLIANYEKIPRNIKVTYGKVDKSISYYNEKRTLTADDRSAEGLKFTNWKIISGDVTIEDEYNSQTTFITNLADVEFEAEYDWIVYNVKCSGGTVNPSTGILGDTINLQAENRASIGQFFKQWVADTSDVTFADKTARVTSFTLPAKDVVIGAVFEDTPLDIIVRNGTFLNDSNFYGAKVTITANDRSKEGLKFVEWKVISGTADLENAASEKTTFMLKNNVILEATYDYEIYQASIGFADASSYTGNIGDTITITAFDRSTEGKVFWRWVFSIGVPAETYTSPTTITFGADRLDGWAEYKDIVRQINVENGKVSSSTGIMGDTITITANDRTPEGYKFKTWKIIKGDITLKDLLNAKTTFQVVLEDVEIVAEYDFIEYAITTKNATSDKATAHLGEIVTLTAEDKTDSNLKFSEWEILKGLINIPQTNPASFTMIPSEVEIEAKYVQKSKPLDQSNYVSVSGIPDKLYGLIESKVAFSKNDYTNSGDRDMTFEWSTPEDGQQGALLRDTLYHVVEASLVVSKNQNDE